MRLALYQGRVEVAVCGRRERQNRELCERIREAGGRAHGYAVDLRDFRALAEFFSRSPWIIRQLLAWSFVTGIAMPVDGDTQA
ncbi:hypothetical protein D3C76_1515660 [compost metagenome]